MSEEDSEVEINKRERIINYQVDKLNYSGIKMRDWIVLLFLFLYLICLLVLVFDFWQRIGAKSRE